jgi:hypothetical protein
MSQSTNAIGCSAFGLADAFSTADGVTWYADFFLADAILPGRLFGSILTGKRAKSERLHSGLPWPPEAQINPFMPLRRAPVPCVWRALVEAGDEQARWNAGEGISFPLGRILAAHVAGMLENCTAEKLSPIVAIPNDLDEVGQENLLYELERVGYPDACLIWRPVASALAWLEEAGQDVVPQRLGAEDFIMVLHMGPDAVECTSFQIAVEKHKELQYVIPRRKRPKEISALTGYDWACCALEQMESIPAEGVAEFWQAFTAFPEIWKCIANREWDTAELPRVWGHSQSWGFWQPIKDNLVAQLNTARCGPSKILKALLSPSCRLSGTEPMDLKWSQRLEHLVLESLEHAPTGKLIGMIVDGPLAQSVAPNWLQACFTQLEQRGLETSGPYDAPELERIWCAPGNKSIARGAAIFGHRLNTGEPTYRDSLPQLYLLVDKDGGLAPVPLFDRKNVRGGEEYTYTIQRQLAITAQQKQLDILICRGAPDPNLIGQTCSTDRLDSHICTTPEGLFLGTASLVRHLIRTLPSVQTALSNLHSRPVRELSYIERRQLIRLSEQEQTIRAALKRLCNVHGPAISDYANTFEAVFRGEDGGTDNHDQPRFPLKKVSTLFPLLPPKEMPVDIHVRIRPASGREKLEVVPEDASFLRGRHIFVDYATMENYSESFSVGQAWPPLEEMIPHPEESIWNSCRLEAQRFLKAAPGSPTYNDLLEQFYVFLRSKPFLYDYGVNFSMLNQEGSAAFDSGDSVVGMISSAIGRHAESLMPTGLILRKGSQRARTAPLSPEERQELSRLIIRGSWLMGATPDSLLKAIRYVLQDHLRGIRWVWVVGAAGRAFRSTDDIALLIQAVVNRFRSGQNIPFPMPAINAVCRILMYRSNGQDGLDENTAHALLGATCDVLDQYATQRRFIGKFFQGLRLLLYLLRWRKRQSAFIKKDSAAAQELLAKLDHYAQGIKHALTGIKRANTVKIIEGIKEFVNFSGSRTTLDLLKVMAGEEGEDNGDGNDLD